jgi:hypothetical protein
MTPVTDNLQVSMGASFSRRWAFVGVPTEDRPDGKADLTGAHFRLIAKGTPEAESLVIAADDQDLGGLVVDLEAREVGYTLTPEQTDAFSLQGLPWRDNVALSIGQVVSGPGASYFLEVTWSEGTVDRPIVGTIVFSRRGA